MKKEIVELLVEELLKRIEEIKTLEIKDRLAYVDFLIREISGIPAAYLPREAGERILRELEKEVRLSNNHFS